MALKTSQLASNIVLRSVDTSVDLRTEQMLAWRGHLDHFLDIEVSKHQVHQGFIGKVDRYSVNHLVYLESLTEAHAFGRSIARISKDTLDFFCFYFIMEGELGSIDGLFKPNAPYHAPTGRCILALDMAQMFWSYRPACRMQAFFIPRPLIESKFTDAETLHGRILPDNTPITHLIFNHLSALIDEIKHLSLQDAETAITTCIELILVAFGKNSKLSGNARAAIRAVMLTQAKRYIEAHLEDETLCSETLIHQLGLPRATLYRLFEHEGGVDAYIRHSRLRQAAFDLIKHPHIRVSEVAYSVGFKNPADFTRSFKRSFELSPSELREESKHLILPASLKALEPMFQKTA